MGARLSMADILCSKTFGQLGMPGSCCVSQVRYNLTRKRRQLNDQTLSFRGWTGWSPSSAIERRCLIAEISGRCNQTRRPKTRLFMFSNGGPGYEPTLTLQGCQRPDPRAYPLESRDATRTCPVPHPILATHLADCSARCLHAMAFR